MTSWSRRPAGSATRLGRVDRRTGVRTRRSGLVSPATHRTLTTACTDTQHDHATSTQDLHYLPDTAHTDSNLHHFTLTLSHFKTLKQFTLSAFSFLHLWPCLQCFDAVGWPSGRASSLKKLRGGVLAWLSVWSEVQTCIWPSWCHCHSLSLASVESRLVLPFWYRLTRAVPDKGPLNGCVCVTESDNNNRHSTTTVAQWDQARPAQTQLDSWRWEHVLQLNFSQDSTSNSSATWWVRVKMRRVCSTQLKHHTSTTHISCRLTNTTGCLRFQSTCIFQNNTRGASSNNFDSSKTRQPMQLLQDGGVRCLHRRSPTDSPLETWLQSGTSSSSTDF